MRHQNINHTHRFGARSLALFLLAFSTLAAAPVWAGSPVQVPVQGLLSDADGQAVDGATQVTFKIYADGSSDAVLWESEISLAVDGGLFEANLGEADELDSDVFAAHPGAHLSMTIAGDAESSRVRLGAVPTAAHAISADHAEDAQTLQGKTPQELAGVSQASLDALIQRVEALEAQRQTLQDQINDNVAALAAVDARVDTAASAHDDLQNQVAAAANQAGTNAGHIATLQANDVAHGNDIGLLLGQVGGFDNAIASLQSDVSGYNSAISALQSDSSTHDSAIGALESKTASMSAETINGKDAVTFDAVNVYIRSGSGSTTGTVNGTGNLIVGYDEARGSSSDKSGSHNLILGREHNYASYAGIAAGQKNDLTAQYASVLGGTNNIASGSTSVVIAGYGNEASGSRSVVVSGWKNLATGMYSAVLGGEDNEARSIETTVGGGKGLVNSLAGYKFMAEGSISP